MEIKTKNVTVLINYQIILLLTHLSQSIFGLAALPLTLHSAGLVYDALSCTI
jgi:hypothetical protein